MDSYNVGALMNTAKDNPIDPAHKTDPKAKAAGDRASIMRGYLITWSSSMP